MTMESSYSALLPTLRRSSDSTKRMTKNQLALRRVPSRSARQRSWMLPPRMLRQKPKGSTNPVQRWKEQVLRGQFGWDMKQRAGDESWLKATSEACNGCSTTITEALRRGRGSTPTTIANDLGREAWVGADLNFTWDSRSCPTSSSWVFCRTEASPSCQRHTGT